MYGVIRHTSIVDGGTTLVAADQFYTSGVVSPSSGAAHKYSVFTPHKEEALECLADIAKDYPKERYVLAAIAFDE